ncbi:four helix bundle protein [Lacihabitans sp. LS3-19]|uniref:four helix bundle protein n=1 Tax=Lacihabitans sp. LS3-19 TaxID=2487335 RepID=UPI0020CD3ED4|nr:four helix bundle protein [Lacihabitans sp. LS3-19]MCP9768411.1 four helix bundle protein [Lacihabitans sp. LS3-19]
MNAAIFKNRTKKLALECGKFVDDLPQKTSIRIYGGQVIRSSASVGANYRAACRAKSLADMINKLKIVEEEADETLYWLELIEESLNLKTEILLWLKKESDEILSMVVASINTLKKKQKPKE